MTALEKWKNDFKEFISELSMPRDDYKGILAYIDEVPNEASEQQPCKDWHDVPSDGMTFEQARQAVKDLRKKLAEDLINQKATTCRHGGHCEWVACDKCNHYEPDGLNQQPCEDCRNCKKWNKCPCGKEGHENGTSIGYSIGECKNYEPCEDSISRQAAIDIIESWLSCDDYNEAERHIMRAMQSVLYDLPSVTPKEKMGHWYIRETYPLECKSWECSECKEVVYEKTKYCPNRGAKMVEPIGK